MQALLDWFACVPSRFQLDCICKDIKLGSVRTSGIMRARPPRNIIHFCWRRAPHFASPQPSQTLKSSSRTFSVASCRPDSAISAQPYHAHSNQQLIFWYHGKLPRKYFSLILKKNLKSCSHAEHIFYSCSLLVNHNTVTCTWVISGRCHQSQNVICKEFDSVYCDFLLICCEIFYNARTEMIYVPALSILKKLLSD